MHKYISKKTFILINIALILIEVVLVYLTINTFLNNDFLSPSKVTFIEYLKLKLSNLI